MNDKSDLLSVTSFFSVLVHAVIILGISFRMPDIANRPNTDNTLDVVLINSANNIRNDDADTISTTDNEGGGQDDLEAESPLPFEAVNRSPVQTIQQVAADQPTNQVTPDQILTANAAQISIVTEEQTETKIENPNKNSGEDLLNTKTARQLERERLIAKITQTQIDYQKRPKKAFLSPSTKSACEARYLNTWKSLVEKIGNAEYPRQIVEQGIIGIVMISVEIYPNGTIANISLLRRSQYKLLNDYSKVLLRRASPFTPFADDECFKDKDILSITRSFYFEATKGFQNRAAE